VPASGGLVRWVRHATGAGARFGRAGALGAPVKPSWFTRRTIREPTAAADGQMVCRAHQGPGHRGGRGRARVRAPNARRTEGRTDAGRTDARHTRTGGGSGRPALRCAQI